MSDESVLVADNLGRRYGRRWGLRDCTLTLPAGRVIGLVGPNGAGKSTLLHLAAGLLEPTTGSVRVLGGPPRGREILPRIAFVGQDKPLYQYFTVADLLRMGQWLNPRWDRASAETRLAGLNIPLTQRAGQLSGGQHAQVALALALAKQPDLLFLDEPVANLDPLARREFLRILLEYVAESGCTVLLSTHLLGDLERACDYLVLLSAARVQLSASPEDLLAEHRVLTGPAAAMDAVAMNGTVVQSGAGSLLIRTTDTIHDPRLTVRPAALEELVLAYMSEPLAGATPALALARGVR